MSSAARGAHHGAAGGSGPIKILRHNKTTGYLFYCLAFQWRARS